MKQVSILIIIVGMLSGTLWGTKAMDPSTYKIQKVEVKGSRISSFAFTSNVAYIGSDSGIKASDLNPPLILEYYNRQNSGLPSDGVTALTVRNGKELWIGTDAGLAMMTIGLIDATIPPNSPFQNAVISSLAADKDGLLWISAIREMQDEGGWIEGMGISSYDGKSWKSYTPANSTLPESFIGSIHVDGQNRKWLATYYNTSERDHGSGLCSFDGKQFSIHGNGKSYSSVECLAVDNAGKVWMGLAEYTEEGLLGGGLACFDGKTWTHYNTTNSDIPGDLVSDITIGKDGTIWMAVLDTDPMYPYSFGLTGFNGQEWRLIPQEKLADQGRQISCLATDPDGKLWVGTDNGLAVVSFPEPIANQEHEFTPYDQPPVIVGELRPEYPDTAKRARVQGTVVLEVEVYDDGRIGEIRVKRSVQGLDESAIEAVRKVKFKPGKAGGKPVNTMVIIPIEFRLN